MTVHLSAASAQRTATSALVSPSGRSTPLLFEAPSSRVVMMNLAPYRDYASRGIKLPSNVSVLRPENELWPVLEAIAATRGSANTA
jgi:hypothetical protein